MEENSFGVSFMISMLILVSIVFLFLYFGIPAVKENAYYTIKTDFPITIKGGESQ